MPVSFSDGPLLSAECKSEEVAVFWMVLVSGGRALLDSCLSV